MSKGCFQIDKKRFSKKHNYAVSVFFLQILVLQGPKKLIE